MPRRRWVPVLAVLTVTCATACAGSAAAPEAAPTRSSPPAAATTQPTPTQSSATSKAEAGPITIAFAGDVHFEAQLRPRLRDPQTALEPIASQLSAADLTVVNLETSIGEGGTPEPRKRFTFQAPPAAFDALAAAGVDVATMANNHAMDFGADGLADTLAAIAADPPMAVIGVGSNADQAFAPAVIDVRGTTIAVIGAHSADDPNADPTDHWAASDDTPGVAVARDPTRLLAAVHDARDAADVVVVVMHWGIQGERCPSQSQAETARALADAGADVVVGSHAHAVQGTGLLNDTYVAYGLGNFVWYNPNSDATSTTGLLTVTVDGGRIVGEQWAPARIHTDGLPRFTTGADSRRIVAGFSELRGCAELTPLG
jgi:poly-gamma-glutamate capsule biosynthesis protein CapA/YwtB (metallophosphatase superfamily)